MFHSEIVIPQSLKNLSNSVFQMSSSMVIALFFFFYKIIALLTVLDNETCNVKPVLVKYKLRSEHFLFVCSSPGNKLCTFLTFNRKTKNHKMYLDKYLCSPSAAQEYWREQRTVRVLCVCARAEMAAQRIVISAASITIHVLWLCGLRYFQIMYNTLFHTIHRAELLTITKANK
jgi:hypothetical protein